MLAKTLLLLLAGMSICTASLAADSARHYVVPPAANGNAAALPFSQGVMDGGTFYVAGHIGMDPTTQKAATDPGAEARLVLDAVKDTLKKAGLGMDDLVSVTVYCTDLRLYDAFNAVYRTYFHAPFPARAFIGVHELLRGAHFEVDGVAIKSHASGL